MTNETAPSTPAPRQEYLDAVFLTEIPTLGLPSLFGVVTAHNPRGVVAAVDFNVAADARLRSQIEKLGLVHFRVTGGSKDGTHQEPGFGIVAEDPEQIRLLCQQFHQQAFFGSRKGWFTVFSPTRWNVALSC